MCIIKRRGVEPEREKGEVKERTREKEGEKGGERRKRDATDVAEIEEKGGRGEGERPVTAKKKGCEGAMSRSETRRAAENVEQT